ncbi:MAG: hypothetical protein ACREBT_03535 [Thermoplasmata archaeon]
MSPSSTSPSEKERRVPSLTVGSRVRILSAGAEDAGLVSVGTYRGLASVGGDNVLAIELDEPAEEKGRIRLIATAALWAIDILEAKAEEEKRSDKPVSTPDYWR